ncbi:MAG: ATP-binding protein, partial [Leptospirales bacterium]|nr:ATP-binding protein [Leptospirales bacterium]
TPERRRELGKDETGKIDLSITIEDNSIEIKLEEDGMGIDYASVIEHAQKLNLITEEDKTDRLKLLNLLFSDTFSTYEVVDLYAGRGAGLSLVKRLVHELNGTLRIKTKDNIGVKWSISIPLDSALQAVTTPFELS